MTKWKTSEELFRGDQLSEREEKDFALKEKLRRLATTRVQDMEEDPNDEKTSGKPRYMTARYDISDANCSAQGGRQKDR